MAEELVSDLMVIEACSVFFSGSWNFAEAEAMRAALEAAMKARASQSTPS